MMRRPQRDAAMVFLEILRENDSETRLELAGEFLLLRQAEEDDNWSTGQLDILAKLSAKKRGDLAKARASKKPQRKSRKRMAAEAAAKHEWTMNPALTVNAVATIIHEGRIKDFSVRHIARWIKDSRAAT